MIRRPTNLIGLVEAASNGATVATLMHLRDLVAVAAVSVLALLSSNAVVAVEAPPLDAAVFRVCSSTKESRAFS